MPKRRIFVQKTPLGYRVILTRDRWRQIVRFKHPAMAGHEADIGECLRDPEHVRESSKDASVHLYYRRARTGYLCVAVALGDGDDRFVVTAYFTTNIKAGRVLWTK